MYGCDVDDVATIVGNSFSHSLEILQIFCEIRRGESVNNIILLHQQKLLLKRRTTGVESEWQSFISMFTVRRVATTPFYDSESCVSR